MLHLQSWLRHEPWLLMGTTEGGGVQPPGTWSPSGRPEGRKSTLLEHLADEGTRRSGGERRKRRAAPGLRTQPEEPVAASCGPVRTATLAMPRDLRWREGAEEAHREGAAGASAVALAWLGACDGGQTRRTKPSFGGAWLEGHGPSVASGSDAAESVSFGGAWLQGHASHRLGEIEASSISSGVRRAASGLRTQLSDGGRTAILTACCGAKRPEALGPFYRAAAAAVPVRVPLHVRVATPLALLLETAAAPQRTRHAAGGTPRHARSSMRPLRAGGPRVGGAAAPWHVLRDAAVRRQPRRDESMHEREGSMHACMGGVHAPAARSRAQRTTAVDRCRRTIGRRRGFLSGQTGAKAPGRCVVAREGGVEAPVVAREEGGEIVGLWFGPTRRHR